MKLFKMISSDVFYPGAIAALINPQGFMIMDNSRASQQSMWKNIPSIATSLLPGALSQNKSTKCIVGKWKELQHLSKHFKPTFYSYFIKFLILSCLRGGLNIVLQLFSKHNHRIP